MEIKFRFVNFHDILEKHIRYLSNKNQEERK